MGNFLDAPITEKQTVTGTANDIQYGVSSMQGWRATMEDAHTVVENVPGSSDISYFAVYDGHGGSLAAKYSAEHMLDVIQSSSSFSGQKTLDTFRETITSAFFAVDEQIRQLPEVGRGDDFSGCTALVAFITPGHIIVGNSGDSRAVLGRQNGTVAMSFDHKPWNEIEKQRIENAGGAVRNRRVNGDLAVSRALGDFAYKGQGNLPPNAQQVSAEPDIRCEDRNGDEEFLVLACDGIWDVMSNDDVCAFVRVQMMNGERNMGLLAEELLDHCLSLGSRDNMSVVIVAFSGARYGSGPGVKGLRQQRMAAKAALDAAKHGIEGQDNDPEETGYAMTSHSENF